MKGWFVCDWVNYRGGKRGIVWDMQQYIIGLFGDFGLGAAESLNGFS